MLSAISKIDAPPAYIWAEQGDNNQILGFLWVGGRKDGITSHVYDVTYQTRGSRPWFIGQIAHNTDRGGWLITFLGRTALPAAESLVYPHAEVAAMFLFSHYREQKRAARKAELAALA